jgi:hypothetical protein
MFRACLNRIYRSLNTGGRKPRSRRIPRTSRRAVVRPALVGLEDRTLLSTLVLSGGVLTYRQSANVSSVLLISDDSTAHRYVFTDTAETIAIQGTFINPSGNGTHTVSFGDSNINSIGVDALNANYFTVNIEQSLSGAPVTINLGNGTDTVNISQTAQNLDNIKGGINVQAGTGIDSLNVYDQSNPNAQTFSLGASSLSRLGSAAITYGTRINFVTINAGNGNNTYNVSGTEASFATTLNTGNGQDTVNVDGSGGTFTVNEGTGGDNVNLGATVHNLNNLQGTIYVNGNQHGVDNLTVDDQANTGSPTFTLNSSSITRPGACPIQYNLLNNVALVTGTGGATVNVQATSTPTSIVGHATGTVNIGNAGSAQQILGALTITNPPSLTSVNVDDSADTTGPTVTLDTNVIVGSAYGRITGWRRPPSGTSIQIRARSPSRPPAAHPSTSWPPPSRSASSVAAAARSTSATRAAPRRSTVRSRSVTGPPLRRST